MGGKVNAYKSQITPNPTPAKNFRNISCNAIENLKEQLVYCKKNSLKFN